MYQAISASCMVTPLVYILDYKANGLDLKEGEVGPNGEVWFNG